MASARSITSPILIDTGPIVAMMPTSQADHARCKEALKQMTPPLLTCWPVLTEAAWLLRKRKADVRDLLDACDNGFLQIVPLGRNDAIAMRASLK